MASNEDRESQRRQPGTLRTVGADHLEDSIYHQNRHPVDHWAIQDSAGIPLTLEVLYLHLYAIVNPTSTVGG